MGWILRFDQRSSHSRRQGPVGVSQSTDLSSDVYCLLQGHYYGIERSLPSRAGLRHGDRHRRPERQAADSIANVTTARRPVFSVGSIGSDRWWEAFLVKRLEVTTSKPALLWPLRPDELRWAPVLRSALRAVSSICCLALVVVGGASAQRLSLCPAALH